MQSGDGDLDALFIKKMWNKKNYAYRVSKIIVYRIAGE